MDEWDAISFYYDRLCKTEPRKYFLKPKKMVFTERIMKIRKVRIVLLLGCLEMIPMILWQSAVQNGVNVLCMSPGKKNYSHVNYPLERIETAIKWLKDNGNRKIGIMGMSTAGTDAIVAASLFPDITLTFGLTASDFVWQGFEPGNKDGCKEWPIPGASTLSWKGEPLPYMPFVYEHPVYWQKVEEETKGSGDIERSTCLFIDSEKEREHTEEEMIKVENIKGKLFLIGADDDLFWEAGKCIRRMDQRLKERPHTCEYVSLVYEHGTHFVLPESLLRKALPVGKSGGKSRRWG